MRFFRDLANVAPPSVRYKIGASVVKNQATRWVSGGAGSVTDPASVTSCPDFAGVTLEAATYSTTQSDSEGTVHIIDSPTALFLCRVVPSATKDTAFADTDGYLLTNTSADSGGTTVTDSDISTTGAAMVDGELFCLTGNNVGQSRIITAHTVSTTVMVVTVPFDNTIAVGDSFLATPYGPGVIAVKLTTDFTQADATDAGGTGAEFVVKQMILETKHKGATKAAPLLYAVIASTDHYLNKA